MKHEIKAVKIYEIVDWNRSQYLCANSEYQRGAVWAPKHQKLLIDSILRGYPLPLFYFHFIHQQSGELVSTRYEIIDGQQRINAITSFVGNGLKLFDTSSEKVSGLPRFLKNQPCSWGGKTFETLPEELQKEFLNREVQIATIRSDDVNEIRELFVRLQQGLPLNSQEKRDAWPGAFTDYVIKTAGKPPKILGHEFFTRVIKTTNKNRGGERQACAQLFMTLQARRDTGNVETFVDLNSVQIDEFYRHHLDATLTDPLFRRFRDLLDVLTDLLDDRKRKPLQVHTALHALILVDCLMDDFAPAWRHKFALALDKFLQNLAQASSQARSEDAESNPYWTQYGIHARANSDTKRAIGTRHRFFVKEMLALMAPLSRRDPKRLFSQHEREILYISKNKTCDICGHVIDWADLEIHHVEPHTDGGMTILENAALVHSTCHPRGRGTYGDGRKRLSASEASNPDVPEWAIDDEVVPEGSMRTRRGIEVCITKDGVTERFSSLNAARSAVYLRIHGRVPTSPLNAEGCRKFIRASNYDIEEIS